MSAEKTRRITRQVLISMTNITAAFKEAEESLAVNDLDGMCRSLENMEKISALLRADVGRKHGVEKK